MNYYPHHIGDFNNATRHLTRVERSLYRDMIELYYDTEQPLLRDVTALCRRLIAKTEEESTAVQQVLNEFFTETEQGWFHERCDEEIRKYHGNISNKSAAGKASAEARAATKAALEPAPTLGKSTDVQHVLPACSTNQNHNQEPEPLKNKPKRDPSGFAAFWTAYPRKVKKPAAEKAFNKIDIALLDKILTSIASFKKSEEWLAENGKYIPHPATWLNDKRWEDEVSQSTAYRPIIPIVKPPDEPRNYKPEGIAPLKSLLRTRETA